MPLLSWATAGMISSSDSISISRVDRWAPTDAAPVMATRHPSSCDMQILHGNSGEHRAEQATRVRDWIVSLIDSVPVPDHNDVVALQAVVVERQERPPPPGSGDDVVQRVDQGGPMAKSAEDCALLLNAMAGFDERDSTSLDRPAEDYARDLTRPLHGLRIGLPREFFGEGCAAGVMTAVQAALAEYEKLGATMVEVSLPNSHLSVPAYYVIAPAEASSNLSRFDGVRYGYRAPEYGGLDDMYKKSRAQGFGDEVKRRILIGTYVLSHGYYDAYYLQAQRIRRLIADDFVEAFKACDVIMGPTSPSTAFKLGEKAADPVQMYLSDIYTIAVNLAGLPGMSIPCGFADGLPVGLQLIGNYFAEARLLNVAHRYQQATDWHQRRPAGVQ